MVRHGNRRGGFAAGAAGVALAGIGMMIRYGATYFKASLRTQKAAVLRGMAWAMDAQFPGRTEGTGVAHLRITDGPAWNQIGNHTKFTQQMRYGIAGNSKAIASVKKGITKSTEVVNHIYKLCEAAVRKDLQKYIGKVPQAKIYQAYLKRVQYTRVTTHRAVYHHVRGKLKIPDLNY